MLQGLSEYAGYEGQNSGGCYFNVIEPFERQGTSTDSGGRETEATVEYADRGDAQ
jgi:hypothetical protein